MTQRLQHEVCGAQGLADEREARVAGRVKEVGMAERDDGKVGGQGGEVEIGLGRGNELRGGGTSGAVEDNLLRWLGAKVQQICNGPWCLGTPLVQLGWRTYKWAS